MIDRAEHLIAALGLIPHPEGGYYGELYRSDATVLPADGWAISAISRWPGMSRLPPQRSEPAIPN